MVNPRADPPIIKMMTSERTPPTTESNTYNAVSTRCRCIGSAYGKLSPTL